MRIAHANPNTTRPGATRPAVSFIAVLATLWALGTGAQAANELPVADRVLVDKSERWMRLYDGDEVLREFKISLGQEPEGDKRQEGDNKKIGRAHV